MNYINRRDFCKYVGVGGLVALVGCGGGGGGSDNQLPSIVNVTRKFDNGRVYYHIEANDTDGSVVEIKTKFNDSGERQFKGSVVDLDELVSHSPQKNTLLVTARDNAGASTQRSYDFEMDKEPKATIKARLDEHKKQNKFKEYEEDGQIWINDTVSSRGPRVTYVDYLIKKNDNTYACLLILELMGDLGKEIDDKKDLLNEKVNVSGFFSMPHDEIISQLEDFAKNGYETQF